MRRSALASAMAVLAAAGCSPVAGGPPAVAFFAPLATAYGELAIEMQAAPREVQALDSQVAKVHLELTGANVPGTSSVDVARSQFENDKAVVRWSELLPGPVSVTAQIHDSADRVLASALGKATIETGRRSTLLLDIKPASGSVAVTVDGSLTAAPTARILGLDP